MSAGGLFDAGIGVSVLEKDIGKRRPQYVDSIRRTNARRTNPFFPVLVKKTSSDQPGSLNTRSWPARRRRAFERDSFVAHKQQLRFGETSGISRST
jgi:hypothetical protein